MTFGEIDGFWFKATPQAAPISLRFTFETVDGSTTVYEKTFPEADIQENVIYPLDAGSDGADAADSDGADADSDNSEDNAECSLGEDIGPHGELTVYSPTPNGGNCDLPWDFYNDKSTITMFAAIPKNPGTDEDAYDSGANCARCARVRCSCKQTQYHGACQAAGEDIIVMLTDSCPSCPIIGDIDLSNAAWDAVTGNEGPSRYDGTWEYVDCPSEFASGNTKMRFKVISETNLTKIGHRS